jgi:hypothetical protein
MKDIIFKMTGIVAFVLFTGCAATYKPINPGLINYAENDLQNGIRFSYKYDMLRERGNNRYSKKEHKHGIKLVAVKFTNNTDTAINISRDIVFFSGQDQISPLEPLMVKNILKQKVPSYLPYLLLTLVTFRVTNGNSVNVYPIGLILGPAITIGNMAVAGSANAKMLAELNQYNLLHRDIKKGETVYGIVGFPRTGYNPITVKRIKP